MDCIAVGSKIEVESSKSPIAFDTKGSGDWKVWDRYLHIEGKPAFHMGNICGTCAFFFERLGGANQKVSAREVSEALRQGLHSLDSEAVLKLQRLLPVGKFTPVLWRWKPLLVTPGSPTDYFVKEQIDLWGIDGFWGLPHNPMTEYYRVPNVRLDEDTGLFQFGIPIYPHNWLERETLDFYHNQVGKRTLPTAVSISVLDIKQPANWDGSPEFNTHYCLAHYLIDGHHKTYAAAASGSACTLLSFVAHDKGISSDKDVEKVVKASFEKGGS